MLATLKNLMVAYDTASIVAANVHAGAEDRAMVESPEWRRWEIDLEAVEVAVLIHLEMTDGTDWVIAEGPLRLMVRRFGGSPDVRIDVDKTA